jgi:UBX domain-containing protein 1/4
LKTSYGEKNAANPTPSLTPHHCYFHHFFRCGPCKASKPALEQLAASYAQNNSKNVKFGIAYEHNLGDAIHIFRVRAFPTYVLFVNSTEVNRIEGVNLEGVKQMIEKADTEINLSAGKSLGGAGGAPLTAEEARAQRLARFGGASPAPPPACAPTPVPAAYVEDPKDDVEMTDDAKEDVEMNDADEEDQKEDVVMVDPTLALDKEAIQSLTESMGFSLIRAQKGLLNGNGGVEGAVEWLMQHQDDDDIDDPIADQPAKAQSYKCNECGRVLSNMANLELHANKTGHSDFEESTQAIKPLTAEERAKKILEIKQLLKAKRAEREESEKVDEVEREKQRRFMGKEMTKTREQMEQEVRKRETQLRRREKQAFEKERDRIRAELAKDKAERIANKGKLSSRLGVDGYNPDGIQYDLEEKETADGSENAAKKAKPGISSAKIDEYIKKVASYRAGGDGGTCLKILKTYIGNVVDNPDEEKFRTINMENKAYKGKVKPFVGSKQLLMAVGFKQNKAGDALVLQEDLDRQLLVDTKAKLEAAFAAY